MVGNEKMDTANEHVRKSAAVSVVSLRAESLSADGDNIVISLRTKYSTAERKYSAQMPSGFDRQSQTAECFQALMSCDLMRRFCTQSIRDFAKRSH